jgi:hypothetical protein
MKRRVGDQVLTYRAKKMLRTSDVVVHGAWLPVHRERSMMAWVSPRVGKTLPCPCA